MAGLGFEQYLAAWAVIRRMAVVFLMFEVVVAVRFVFDFILTVTAGGIAANAF